MSLGSIQHPVLFCKVQLMHFGYVFINTVACMILTPVMQFTNFFFFFFSVIDNVNILIINVKLKHRFTDHFKKILHKLHLCTLTILTLTTYTCNHVAVMIL